MVAVGFGRPPARGLGLLAFRLDSPMSSMVAVGVGFVEGGGGGVRGTSEALVSPTSSIEGGTGALSEVLVSEVGRTGGF